MNRGDRREAIFRDEEDRLLFLVTLERLEQMVERRGPSHYGAELKESEEEKAEVIVRKELKRLKWNNRDLEQRAKCDRGKLGLAAELRRHTTMSLKWVTK